MIVRKIFKGVIFSSDCEATGCIECLAKPLAAYIVLLENDKHRYVCLNCFFKLKKHEYIIKDCTKCDNSGASWLCAIHYKEIEGRK